MLKLIGEIIIVLLGASLIFFAGGGLVPRCPDCPQDDIMHVRIPLSTAVLIYVWQQNPDATREQIYLKTAEIMGKIVSDKPLDVNDPNLFKITGEWRGI